MLARDAHRLARVDQAHIGVLAHHDRLGEGEDAGEGDVEIGQDADRRRLDHVLAKAVEVARAGAAGIDEGGDAAGAGQKLGLDAERRAAPVDVGMQIDEAGRDDLACDVAHVLARQIVADGRDLAVREGDVGHLVERLRGIDDPSAFENQVVHQFLKSALSHPAHGFCQRSGAWQRNASSPSQSAISRSSSRSGPATAFAS